MAATIKEKEAVDLRTEWDRSEEQGVFHIIDLRGWRNLVGRVMVGK